MGRPKGRSGRVDALLERWFDAPSRGEHLPVLLTRWVRTQRAARGLGLGPAEPTLVLERGGDRLTVRFVGRSEDGDPDLLVLSERLRGADHEAAGRRLGLTRREAEVLALVAQGLTDRDVADRLVLSRRTVEKHLERVYDKLGVGTRTAALARLRDEEDRREG